MTDIFIYGTLLNDEVLTAILDTHPVKYAADLHGYKNVTVRGECFPAVRPASDNKVSGVLLTALCDDDIKKLDAYEGKYYQRTSVLVQLTDGVSKQCMTYVFKPEYYKFLSNEPWCNTHFRHHDMQQYVEQIVREY